MKLLIISILVSIVWLVPNYKTFESINKIYQNASHYQPAIFNVTGHHETPVIRSKHGGESSYLLGDVFVTALNKTFTNEYYDDNKIYKNGELIKAYPIGIKIKVQFNSLEKHWENGQTMRVHQFQNSLSLSEIENKRERFQRIAFGPLVASLCFTLLYILLYVLRRKK